MADRPITFSPAMVVANPEVVALTFETVHGHIDEVPK